MTHSVIITIGDESFAQSKVIVKDDKLELLQLTKDYLIKRGFDELRYYNLGDELNDKLYEMQENSEGFALKFEAFGKLKQGKV